MVETSAKFLSDTVGLMNGVSPAVRGVFRRRLLSGVMALALGLTAAGCGSNTEIIKIDGSSTVFPITEAVAEEFQREHKGAVVTVGVSGTGGGFQKFCRGELDLADASRPIRQVEMDACAGAGITFIELPVAYDGITIVVHPKNTWAQSMTVAELKKLWEPAAEGKITRWSQIREGWPDREIHLFGAGVDSGTFDYFTEAIVGKQDASRGDYTSSEDDNMLVQGVSGDEYSLGFFGYAYYETNQNKLRAVAIDDGSGKSPVLPTPETIRTGQYRPLSRPVFIYVYIKSLDRPIVQQFADYYVQNAPKLVREVGYVPLTGEEYQLVAKRASGRTPGTVFKTHHPEPGTTLLTLLQQQ
jgi:phosphate transport system substrate-binding protein